jgi:hypothetical protein
MTVDPNSIDLARVVAGPPRAAVPTGRGRPLQDTAYTQVWHTARHTAQQTSPLARRPYDLRQAAVSLWLNSDIPAAEVTRRAGHASRCCSPSTPTASTDNPRPPAPTSTTPSNTPRA